MLRLIKCIIVEDETLAQNVIQSHLQKIPGFELVAICGNALEAKELLSKEKVDLIFLDIQLPGMTGLNFLRTLQNPPLVILTTAYAEYAIESYEFNIADYLLKPISFERFSKSINKIIDGELLSSKIKTISATDHIYIKSNGRFLKVNFSEIIYIEGMKDYLKICTADEKIITLQTMSEMEKLLPADQFIRVHKSYIVSIARIKSIFGNNIETPKLTIPIGINYKEKVMQLTGKRFN
jgi:two-component system, LytTR family, response regulator